MWRQEPIYGSKMLKIVLRDYLTYPHIWLKEQEENKKDRTDRTAKKDKIDIYT